MQKRMHWRQASDVAATVEVLPAKNLPLHGGPVINWFQSLAEKKRCSSNKCHSVWNKDTRGKWKGIYFKKNMGLSSILYNWEISDFVLILKKMLEITFWAKSY